MVNLGQNLTFLLTTTKGFMFSATINQKASSVKDAKRTKKKPSPSTLNRNAKRKEAFILKKKCKDLKEVKSPSKDIDKNQWSSFLVRKDIKLSISHWMNLMSISRSFHHRSYNYMDQSSRH